MQTSIRPYATAGVALATAGIIAVSPVAPPLPDIEVPAVQLTASFDPITPWLTTFDNSETNLANLRRFLA